MKILQIVAAHVNQGDEPAVYGLGDDGMLYEWVAYFDPQTGQETEYRALTEEEKQPNLPRPWNVRVIDGVQSVPTGNYKTTYRDGWTAGWRCLGNKISKPIIHPEDPTRAERS